MRPARILLGSLIALLLTSTGRAASPLRLVPEQADFVLQVHEPRRLVETLTTLDAVKQLQRLEAVKEILDSTSYRRFYQLIAHVEKELGLEYNELLDKLAGGGAVVSAQYGDKPPVLLAVQGTDPAVVEKFFRLAIRTIEQELARQDVKVKLAHKDYHGVEVFSLGNDLHAARIDSALLISSKREKLQAGIDCALGKEKKSLATHAGLIEAARLLPPKPLASIWFDIEPARKNPMFKAFYDTPRDPFITIVLGSWANLLGRTPYLAGGFYADSRELMLTFRVPRGSEGMGAEGQIYCAPEGPRSRPLLQPKGTLLSSSYHYDISRFWTDRVELFGEVRAKEFEAADKAAGTPFSSVGLSKLLTCLSGHQRIVATLQGKSSYKKQPRNRVPAVALVTELRKPEDFSKGVETVLGAVGLTLTPQFGLKIKEEKIGDIELVGYRFDEKKNVANDPDGFRFNFSPCYARVGNQFLFCSTMELGREIVGLLQLEAKSQDRGSIQSSRITLRAAAGKELLKNVEEQLVTTAVLGQALPLDQAKAQVKAFLAVFDLIDGFSKEETYKVNEFHLDLRLKFKK